MNIKCILNTAYLAGSSKACSMTSSEYFPCSTNNSWWDPLSTILPPSNT